LWSNGGFLGQPNEIQRKTFLGYARALEEGHLPYDVIIFGHPELWDDTAMLSQLSKYNYLILPYIDCISDRHLQAINSFVTNGGILIAVGGPDFLATKDEDHALRDGPGLTNIALNPGNGRVVFIQETKVTNFYNFRDNLSELTLPFSENVFIVTDAPPEVGLNILEQNGRILVHLVNYDYSFNEDTFRGKKDIRIKLRISEVCYIKLISPEIEEKNILQFSVEGNYTTFTVPELKVWDVIVIEKSGYSEDITLQSPDDASVFNSCSLINNHQPTFSWTANETFTKYTILFSTSSSDFTTAIGRVNIQGTQNNWTPTYGLWRKIMTSSNNNGNIRDIYWKVIGTRTDKTTTESEVRDLQIGAPQAVTIDAPLDGATLSSVVVPTFDFNTNCNIKFRLEFSPSNDFADPKRMKGFNFSTKDPNVSTVINWGLTTPQWNSVKKLVETGTSYFRIKAWDRISRETISEVRSFTAQQ
jgi:hypothetical protein